MSFDHASAGCPRLALMIVALCYGAPISPIVAGEAVPSPDLARRLADLEADLRRIKGRAARLEHRQVAPSKLSVASASSRVKVTVYGQVSRSIVFHAARRDGSVHHVDNDGSPSRVGILARARAAPGLVVSGITEVEWTENRRSITGDVNDGNIGIQARTVELSLNHARFGTLWIGQGSLAAEAAGLFTLSGTSTVFAAIVFDAGVRLNSTSTGQEVAANAIAPGLYYGVAATVRRGNRVMYGSPRIGGFHVRVSHAEHDVVDAAAHYLGHPLGAKHLRVLAGLGFIRSPASGATVPGVVPSASNTVTGSVGLLHLPTGLSLALAAGTTRVENAPGVMNPYYWYVETGWQRRLWSPGKTYFSLGYAQSHGGFSVVSGAYLSAAPGNDIHAWRVNAAVLQEIDAAAADVYLGYAFYDAKRIGTKLDGAHLIVLGGRIKF